MSTPPQQPASSSNTSSPSPTSVVKISTMPLISSITANTTPITGDITPSTPHSESTFTRRVVINDDSVKDDPDSIDDFSMYEIYPSGTKANYDEFTERTPQRDTEIIVGDGENKRSFFVNGAYMAEISTFFREMYMRSPKQMIMQRENANRLLMMLQVMHAHPARPLTTDKVGVLAVIIRHLHGICQQFIVSNLHNFERGKLNLLFEGLARKTRKTWLLQQLVDYIGARYTFEEIDKLRIEDGPIKCDLYRRRGRVCEVREKREGSEIREVKQGTSSNATPGSANRKRNGVWENNEADVKRTATPNHR